MRSRKALRVGTDGPRYSYAAHRAVAAWPRAALRPSLGPQIVAAVSSERNSLQLRSRNPMMGLAIGPLAYEPKTLTRQHMNL